MNQRRITSWPNTPSPFLAFDELFDGIKTSIAQDTKYPPYNSYKIGDELFIEIACAGFSREDLTVDVDGGGRRLTIKGKSSVTKPTEAEWLHRGLSARDFEKAFTLGNDIEVKDASYKDGILTVSMKRRVDVTAKTVAIR